MKNWWRKWTYEIPLAFGDALWEVLVVQFAAFLGRLTAPRVIEFVAIAILAMAFAQTFPIDLAFLFAGDTLMYLEILVVIRLAAGRDHVRAMPAPRRAAGPARDTPVAAAVDLAAIAHQPAARGGTPPRPARPRIPDRSAERDDGLATRIGWRPGLSA